MEYKHPTWYRIKSSRSSRIIQYSSRSQQGLQNFQEANSFV